MTLDVEFVFGFDDYCDNMALFVYFRDFRGSF